MLFDKVAIPDLGEQTSAGFLNQLDPHAVRVHSENFPTNRQNDVRYLLQAGCVHTGNRVELPNKVDRIKLSFRQQYRFQSL